MTIAQRRQAARRDLPHRLRRHLRDRGMRQQDLAALLGVREATISGWVRGVSFPSMARAADIAEHLDAPVLADLIVAAHSVECIICGRVVVHRTQTTNPRYCSHTCKATQSYRARRDLATKEGMIARRRLSMYQEAVDAFCRRCEPEGQCRDGGCDLRAVSPLPLGACRGSTGAKVDGMWKNTVRTP